MIWESHYWKKPLLEMDDRLERLKASDNLSDEQMVQIERDVFIGFYSARKLFEARTKVTDRTRVHTLSLSPSAWRESEGCLGHWSGAATGLQPEILRHLDINHFAVGQAILDQFPAQAA